MQHISVHHSHLDANQSHKRHRGQSAFEVRTAVMPFGRL
jgi:hypothetical protein